MKAAIYARYSTDLQREQSLDDQFRVCERIAERHGFTVVARHSDAAMSGGTTERPSYQAMLAAARRREFDAIIAEDTSRLWRSLSEQSPRVAELSDLGIHVVTHDWDTRLESAGILGAVNGAMSEHYRREIARRTRRGMEGLARNGKPTGGRAFGYVSATDSGTGKIEIEPAQANVVRRVFEMYADGSSPRSIAATLNAEGVPSPGASWQRVSRRKSKWMGSAIWGNPTRGNGMLNNEQYIGRVIWNRCRWVRSAADSSKRRYVANPKSEWIVREEPRLRIVSDALWQRVRARQAQQSKAPRGELNREGKHRQRAPGAGRKNRYLLSGLLRCGVCDATFVMSNAERYQCASHMFGRACSNTLSVRRTLVESLILDSVKADLRNPQIIAEVEKRCRQAANKRRAPIDNGARIAALRREVSNLTDAIAGGLLKSSPALAERLQAAESELTSLQAASAAKVSNVGRIVPRVAERYNAMLGRLDEALRHDAERGRAALQTVIGESVTLQPDKSGKFMWAEFGIETAALLQATGGGKSAIVVAGAGFVCASARPPVLLHRAQ